MDQLNGKQSLTTAALFTLQSTLKSVHVKELNCFLYQTVHFPSFPIFIFCFFLFVTLVPSSFFFFFFFNVVPSSAHFHVAGPDKWIRGPWQVIAVVQHVQEYVFSIKFWLCFSLPAAHSYQVYLDTKTLIGPRANKWMVVSQGDKLLVGLHVTEYWMLIGRGRGVGYNRETSSEIVSLIPRKIKEEKIIKKKKKKRKQERLGSRIEQLKRAEEWGKTQWQLNRTILDGCWGEPQASPTVTCWLGFLSRYRYRRTDLCLWSGARLQGRMLWAKSSRRNFVCDRSSVLVCIHVPSHRLRIRHWSNLSEFSFRLSALTLMTAVQKILGLRNWMPSSQRSRDFLLPQGQPASKHVLSFSDFLAHRESLFDKTTLSLQLTVV